MKKQRRIPFHGEASKQQFETLAGTATAIKLKTRLR